MQFKLLIDSMGYFPNITLRVSLIQKNGIFMRVEVGDEEISAEGTVKDLFVEAAGDGIQEDMARKTVRLRAEKGESQYLVRLTRPVSVGKDLETGKEILIRSVAVRLDQAKKASEMVGEVVSCLFTNKSGHGVAIDFDLA
jgi:hypothetical protein